ncbi:MAG: winged helix-turn-helix transcriptional regulator [Candidatus Aramenus sp.]|jgi:DNA-binding Lrp family transcriptional regulator|nr:winged helix-turn-helix transcriptional regulator [Candidatus Aramenus sp.]
MDAVDKKIVFYLLKDGRISQRRIAALLGLNPASLNYRFKKLLDSGTLKGFKLYVNPNLLGFVQTYVVFKNYKDFDADWISFRLKCLEWYNVYGVYGRDSAEIKDRLGYMQKVLGEPVLTYFPAQFKVKLSQLDLKILDLLRKDPRMSSSKIAKSLGVATKKVEKHIKNLKFRGLIMIVPVVDLGNLDSIVFSIFSKKIEDVSPILQECKIWQFTDGYAGITVCNQDRMEGVKKYVSAVREVDKEAEMMLIYGYDFKTVWANNP